MIQARGVSKTYPVATADGDVVIGCHRVGETVDVERIVTHFDGDIGSILPLQTGQYLC